MRPLTICMLVLEDGPMTIANPSKSGGVMSGNNDPSVRVAVYVMREPNSGAVLSTSAVSSTAAWMQAGEKVTSKPAEIRFKNTFRGRPVTNPSPRAWAARTDAPAFPFVPPVRRSP